LAGLSSQAEGILLGKTNPLPDFTLHTLGKTY